MVIQRKMIHPKKRKLIVQNKREKRERRERRERRKEVNWMGFNSLPFEVIDIDHLVIWSTIIIHHRLSLWKISSGWSKMACSDIWTSWITVTSFLLPPIHNLMTSIEWMPQFDRLKNDHLLRVIRLQFRFKRGKF